MSSYQTFGYRKRYFQDFGKNVFDFSGYTLKMSLFLLLTLGSQDCFEVEKNVLRALALGFKLPEEYFLRFHTKPDNQLRLLHYPRFA